MSIDMPSFWLMWNIIGALVLALSIDDAVAANREVKIKHNMPGYVMPWWAILLFILGAFVLWPFVLFNKLRKLAK